MTQLTDLIKVFFTGLGRSRLALTGAILATVLFPALLVSLVIDHQGLIAQPLFGFIVYLVLGPLFVLGLLMILLGLFFFRGKEEISRFTYQYLKDHFTAPEKFLWVRNLVVAATLITVFNLIFIGMITYSGHRYTESIAFCGALCHASMAPQHTSHQLSTHSQVLCVECHIGPGLGRLVKGKTFAAREIGLTLLGNYERPIASPLEHLRPSKENCRTCHRSELLYGEKLRVITSYRPDAQNTPLFTVLLMKTGHHGRPETEARNIHWHVAPGRTVSYLHHDRERQEISEVRVSQEDGSELIFRRQSQTETDGKPVEKELQAGAGRQGVHSWRGMDCVDCHNRASHGHFTAAEAVDRKILNGAIPAELPFSKRQSLAAIARPYASATEAEIAIATRLESWYRENLPELTGRKPELLHQAVAGARQAWRENVFPAMGVGWETYQDFLGHRNDSGCFRCHNPEMRSKDGRTIPNRCDLCHLILAVTEETPDIPDILKHGRR